jgi:type I restriction enzyme R subunit
VRIHKRQVENGSMGLKESQVFEALQIIKKSTDEQMIHNSRMIENEAYFNDYLLQLLVRELKQEKKINLDFNTAKSINNLIVQEYFKQYNGNRI